MEDQPDLENLQRMVVAVIKDQDGALGDPSIGGQIEFWVKTDNAWIMFKTFDFEPLRYTSAPAEANALLDEMAKELKVASVVAAKGFPGLAFQVLLKAGPVLCEMPDFEPEWLEDIIHAAFDPAWENEAVALTPIESPPGSGVFEIDLTAALEADPELSSKTVLKPFLENVPFLELKVLYDHFPPWLKDDLKKRGMGCQLEKKDSEVLMTIAHKHLPRS